MFRDVMDTAYSAIQRGQWQRRIRGSSDEFLEKALSNFKNWRAEPNGDYSLSPAELDKRIAIIKGEIASRPVGRSSQRS